MLKSFVTLVFVIAFSAVNGQVLFTYGKDSVTAAEFLKAYKKNNAATAKDQYTISSYLDLYINSRLKIKEAKAEGLDTLPQMVSDLQNLRAQIVPGYLNDEQGLSKLIEEAFLRSQKDIHLAHIFISYTKTGIYNEVAAEKTANDIYQRLQKGESFSKLAAEFSDDPSAKANGGDIGFITAFTLPYELENLAYTTQAGQLSKLHHSKAGIHIFKNLGERPSPGTMKAAEILLAFPPDADEKSKAAIKKSADSLYNRLTKGDDFGKLAEKFSNDVVSAASQGMITEFGTGEYDPAFESVAFSLLKDGAVSKPFLTSHGWHIVKRISRIPVNKDSNNLSAIERLAEKTKSSDRINTTRASLAKKLAAQVGFKNSVITDKAISDYYDSILNQKNPSLPTGISGTSVLFTTGKKNITAADWIEYARTFRYKSDGTGIKQTAALWEEFKEWATIEYYKDNLEFYNPDFKAQLEEFKDGNLFFEVMQRKVWGPAQADTAALEKYFNSNRQKYQWIKSADAIVFYTNDADVASKAYNELKKNPSGWRQVNLAYEESLAADSNRFESDQLPGEGKDLKAGTFTKLVKNDSDNTIAFAYVIRIYPNKEPRSFADAKGLVINDYQDELEMKWLNQLRAKYPVTINQTVLQEMQKKN
jgi:peptidyl-prolyl cis-trans isomerase SurA